MLKLIMTAGAAALISAPAFAQSSGNLGALLGGSNGGSSLTNSRTGALSVTNTRNNSRIGGLAVDPQVASSRSTNGSRGSSSSSSASVPLAFGGAKLGGGSTSIGASHSATTTATTGAQKGAVQGMLTGGRH